MITETTDAGVVMPGKDPLEASLEGYVSITNIGRDGLSIGGYAKRPEDLADHPPWNVDAIIDIRRARDIARRFHDWDVPTEEEMVELAMAGV